jgi:pimeloyl-ACP methyl ester carboxylesterase
MNTPGPENECTITAGDVSLSGFLDVPDDAAGIVVFAHGSGSSRFSRRNQAVAAFLREARLGTLLFDLLTSDEERVDVLTREHRFDIPLLSRRLADAVRWVAKQPDVGELPVGLFGSSTGAAAALIVAAELPDLVAAVVSRGGRADLAGEFLGKVQAPTLLIVGGADTEVLRLNRAAGVATDPGLVPGSPATRRRRGAPGGPGTRDCCLDASVPLRVSDQQPAARSAVALPRPAVTSASAE